MDRLIAIILGIMVVLIAFFVIKTIIDDTESIDKTGNDLDCTVGKGGTCVGELERCPDGYASDNEVQCNNEGRCCVKPN